VSAFVDEVLDLL